MNRPADVAAVRWPLEPGPAIDPFALAGSDGIVFVSEGRVLVGLGRAAVVSLPHGLDVPADLEAAARALASVPCDDRVGPAIGVMAFGALPFDRSAPAALTVPEVVFGVEPSGRQWVTVATADRSRLPTRPEGLRAWLRPHGGPASDRKSSPPRVMPLSTEDSFEAMVDDALAAIHRGELSKVVLARQVEVTTDDTIDIAGLLRRWHRLEPNCTVFSLPDADGQFVGASPELLVERSGLRVLSRPLAGTTDRTAGASGGGAARGTGTPSGAADASPFPAELLRSQKDATEHRLVVEAIAGRLGPLCTTLEVPDSPHLVHLHNIVHLGTSLTGTLRPPTGGRPPSALELVGALHPTPAVGGVPTEVARTLIARLEPQSRGSYAGPVGYLDSRGDGRWMLGIRAVSIRDRTARLAAGVGIVDGSDPRAELAETTLKFNAVFDALAPEVRLAVPGPTPRHQAVG